MKNGPFYSIVVMMFVFLDGADAARAPSHHRSNGGQGDLPEVKTSVSISLTGNSTIDIYCAGSKKKWPRPPKASGKIRVLLPKDPNPFVAGGDAPKTANKWIQSPKPLPEKPTGVSYTCSNSRSLSAGLYGFSWNAKWTPNPAPCWGTPPFNASVSGGIVVWNSDGKGGVIYVPRIKTTTVASAKTNSKSSRKKIGVGEVVTCDLEYAPSGGNVSWTTTGDGGCKVEGDEGTSSYSASFTAGDEATSAGITASFTATVAEQDVSGNGTATLTIVEPGSVTGGEKKNEGDSNNPGENPPSGTVYAGAYMAVRWHLKPDDVSFSNVQTQELECEATNMTGCYRDANRHHDEVGWIGYGQNNDDTTSNGDSLGDRKGATEIGPPAKWHNANGSQYEAGGEYTWNIPWRWRVIAIGNVKGSETNAHHVTVTESGTMTIQKLGKSTTEGPHTFP